MIAPVRETAEPSLTERRIDKPEAISCVFMIDKWVIEPTCLIKPQTLVELPNLAKDLKLTVDPSKQHDISEQAELNLPKLRIDKLEPRATKPRMEILSPARKLLHLPVEESL